jgi:hypothetical protein
VSLLGDVAQVLWDALKELAALADAETATSKHIEAVAAEALTRLLHPLVLGIVQSDLPRLFPSVHSAPITSRPLVPTAHAASRRELHA